MTGQVRVVAVFEAQDGRGPAVVEAARAGIEATRAEPGCLLYTLNRDVDRPDRLVFVEQWESRGALEAHLGSAHLQAFLAAVGDLLDAPPTVMMLEPAG